MSVTIYRLFNTLTGSICKRDFRKRVLRILLRTLFFGAGKIELHNDA